MDKLESGGIKIHALMAYNWMIKSVKLYLSSPEAPKAFKKNRLVSQINLPELDMMVEVVKEIKHQKNVLPTHRVGEHHGRHH